MNLSIKGEYFKIVKIENEYYNFRELHLGSGIILHIIQNIKKRSRPEQINIYDAKDFLRLIIKYN
jgi:hypothetical protein